MRLVMKKLKKLMIIALMVGISFVAYSSFNYLAEAAPSADESQQTQRGRCPKGSYDIGITKDGKPICKLEPTGCPYGDSIPMSECDRFKPKPRKVRPNPVVQPTWGK